jgi:hypothetical protein
MITLCEEYRRVKALETCPVGGCGVGECPCFVADPRRGEIIAALAMEHKAKTLEPSAPVPRPRFEDPKPKRVSLGRAVLDFAGAMWRWGKAGLKIVTQEEHDARLAHCEQPCEHWLPSTGQCDLCRCFTEQKTWMATEKCPVNKWLATVNNG